MVRVEQEHDSNDPDSRLKSLKTRVKELEENQRNPSLLDKFGPPPITPKVIGEALTIEECYQALSKKLDPVPHPLGCFVRNDERRDVRSTA